MVSITCPLVCNEAARRNIVFAVMLLLTISGAAVAVRSQESADTPDDAVAIFTIAQDLHESCDLKGAIDGYKKALSLMPEFPEAEFQIGSAYLGMGKAVEAEAAMRRAVELRPAWTLGLTSLGTILLRGDKIEEAEQLLKKALEIDDKNFPALAALAELRLKTHSSPAVLRALLDQIVVLTGKASPTAALWSARGSLENALGDTRAAKSSFANALTIDPTSRFALIESAEFAIRDGDIIRAGLFTDELEASPGNTTAVKLLRTKILAADGKLAEAKASLADLPEKNTEMIAWLSDLDRAASTDAVALESELASDPNNVLVLDRLCTIERTSDPAKALKYCKMASEIEPGNLRHALGFGAALVQANRLDEAIELFRKLLKIAPENTTSHANLATALFQSKRFAEAKTEFAWIIHEQPASPIAYYFLGISHDRLNEYLDAMANYQLFLKYAEPAKNQLEIDKVNLRLPALSKLTKSIKGRKTS